MVTRLSTNFFYNLEFIFNINILKQFKTIKIKLI